MFVGSNHDIFLSFLGLPTSSTKIPSNKTKISKHSQLDILRNMIDNLHSEDAGAPLSIPSQSHFGSLDTSPIFDMVGSTIQKPASKSATTSILSLGDLSTTMELERSKETRKSELSPQAREALRMAYECLAEMHNIVVTPELMTVWSSHRKASTVKDMPIVSVFGITIAPWKALNLFRSMKIIWLRGLQQHRYMIKRHLLLIIEVLPLPLSTQSFVHATQTSWDL